VLRRALFCTVILVLGITLVFAESTIRKQAVAITSSGNVFSLSPDTYDHSVARMYETPDYRQDDSLWYGSLVYNNALGLTAGGTFEFAIRLTPTELGPFTGWTISGIKFHKYSGNLNNVVKVYDNGTATTPGGMITSEPYTSSAPDEWVTVMLSSPVTIPGTGDLWCSVEVTHAAGTFPASMDAGPAIDGKGDWIYFNNAWQEIQDLGFNNNWLIIAYLEQTGAEPDIEISLDTLEFDYATNDTVNFLVIDNVGAAALDIDSIIPQDFWIVSVIPNALTIPAGSVDSVQVTVMLDTLVNGTYYSYLDIYSNDPDESPYMQPVKFTVTGVGVEEESPSHKPAYTVLTFPNPMRTSGTISYSVPMKTDVEINIYDISGRLINQVEHNIVNAGTHTVVWNRKDAYGVEVPQGVYIYEFITPLYNETGKIIVLR